MVCCELLRESVECFFEDDGDGSRDRVEEVKAPEKGLE